MPEHREQRATAGRWSADLVARHALRQSGVVSRRQVIEAGGDGHDIARLIRRREWARVLEGVYVGHTGPLTWEQRAWAAVLFCGSSSSVDLGAALAGPSALRAHRVRGHEGDGWTVHVVVPLTRRVESPAWIHVQRIRDFDARVLANLAPPRLRMEEALLQVASRARDDAAGLAVLGDACQRGHSTPARLVSLLEERARLPRRALLLDVLADVATGAYSVLERRYLRDVERSHRLPTGKRQRRVRLGGSVFYRDVEYLGLRTNVELDGRLGHDGTADRWSDLDRDLEGALAGTLTVRVGWMQVLEPCRLAGAVGSLLRLRGWSGAVQACGPSCQARDSGGSRSRDEGDPPLSA